MTLREYTPPKRPPLQEVKRPEAFPGEHAPANDGSANLRTLKLIPFDQLGPKPGRGYLLKNFIPRRGLVVLWGPPKCGKSFAAFDMAMSVARGIPYRGHRVQQGAVAYVAAEGGDGFRNRAEAYRREFLSEEATGIPFFLLPQRINLTEQHGELIAAIRASMGDTIPALVVMDTLNRTFSGSESSDQDMTAYVAAADAVQEAFGCAVAVVHHCGHESSRPRGHTSLMGAADAQIACSRDAAGTMTLTVEFMKDGPEGGQMFSRLKVVELGQDEDGEAVTSCVVEEADAPATVNGMPKLSGGQKQAYDALIEAMGQHGQASPGGDIPTNAKVVSVQHWRDQCLHRGVTSKEGNERQKWKKLHDSLIDKSAVAQRGDLVWVPSLTVTNRNRYASATQGYDGEKA